MHRNTRTGGTLGVFVLFLVISTICSSASAQLPGPFGGGFRPLLPPPPLAPWRNTNQMTAQPTQAQPTAAQAAQPTPTQATADQADQPVAAQPTEGQPAAQPTEAQPAAAPAAQAPAEEPSAKVTEADPYVKTPAPENAETPASDAKQPAEGEVVQKSLKIAIPAEALTPVENAEKKPAEDAEKKSDLQASDLRPEVQQTIEQINTQEENQPVTMPLLEGLRLTVKEILALNEALARFLSPQEFAAVQGLNNYRARCGLFPCLIDLSLCNAARYHSTNMQSRGFFDHVAPWGENFLMRAARYGTSASAENIFMGSSSGMAANNAWINSSGHRANMVGPYQRVGVGNAGGFFTQVFGR